ncbi:MAG: TIR domain-containing protein [Symploca sp. SIO1C4]|uniref:TIR domain-containing protein n=1 Tax=Symploca sp. SIO1C4 TaxID=2607765 RepID=A0A6B3NBV7_9CYAN|nr:TIR domain-containing protein [Symploca sp. SIO1C4]
MPNLFDAFISYGRADSKAFATKLHSRLLKAGLKIWFDQDSVIKEYSEWVLCELSKKANLESRGLKIPVSAVQVRLLVSCTFILC